ncbi:MULTISPECIES: hypothetical protein [Olivibacter]|uniref:DUF927 domain-containing protein n=1 Tax=Olivibacter jilunii TaxID=985016 RepID=A0ABW6AYI2_9SPHI
MDNPVFEYIQENKQNGIMYKADYLLFNAEDDIEALDNAIAEIAEVISFLPSESLQEDYASRISKNHKIKIGRITKRIKELINVREEKEKELREKENGLPSWIEAKRFYQLGFDSKVDGYEHTGIYFHMGSDGCRQLTNFTMKPLIHVYSEDDNENRRLTEVNNGVSKTVMELPSKAFTSVDQFESILMNKGVFFLKDGFTKSNLNKLKAVYLKEYPKCYELKTLGWQQEGFWAYSNKVFTDSLQSFNEYGFVAVGETNYLSMAASNIQREVRKEDDALKNDRYLTWQQAPIDFSEWATLMCKVYDIHGWYAVACSFVALFRDIVYEVDNYCPHLYPYGAVQAGKSKFGESFSNLFFNNMPAFNLNQGTDFAFWNRLGRFRNCPVVLNEFDENAIKEEWFRGIKAAADGEGREKGTGRKNRTTSMEVNCFIVLIGQYLSTKDDASVLSRSIPRAFKENNNRTQEQVANYEKLKRYEKNGLSGILTEMLAFRKEVSDNYASSFSEVMKEMTKSINKDGIHVKTRIQKNFCTLLGMVKILIDKMHFPFTYDQFFEDCKSEIIKLSSMISESDSLANFWKMLEFMVGQEMIEPGFDFKIETVQEVSLLISRADVGPDGTNTKKQVFDEPKRLLFLRLNSVHPLYLKEFRTQTGKTGLNYDTILTYMKDQPYYLGNNKSSSFRSKNGKSTITSSFVFDYDAMNVNLIIDEDIPGREETFTGEITGKAAEVKEITSGVLKSHFKIKIDRSYKKDGFDVMKVDYIDVWTNQLDMNDRLKVGTTVKVKGLYNERGSGERVYRDIQASKIDIINVEALLANAVEGDWTEA